MKKDIFYDGNVVTGGNDLRITSGNLADLNRARNILQTVKGEYPYNEELGVLLKDSSGQPLSHSALLQSYIRQELKTRGIVIEDFQISMKEGRVAHMDLKIHGETLEVRRGNTNL